MMTLQKWKWEQKPSLDQCWENKKLRKCHRFVLVRNVSIKKQAANKQTNFYTVTARGHKQSSGMTKGILSGMTQQQEIHSFQ